MLRRMITVIFACAIVLAAHNANAWDGERKGFILDRKSTRLNSSHIPLSRMPSSA